MIRVFEEFNLFKKLGKGIRNIIPERKRNPMTEEDDHSTDFSTLLKKAYENGVLYIRDLYGHIREKRFTGVTYIIPFSDGKEGLISINFSNYIPGVPNTRITPEDPYGEEDWGGGPEILTGIRATHINRERVREDDYRFKPYVKINDRSDDFFSSRGGGYTTDDVEEFAPLLRCAHLLFDTEYNVKDTYWDNRIATNYSDKKYSVYDF